ncbi:MAG: efflux RND transporter periplasmic adaptor subunit [Cyclonatronaceae bacterium]
MKKAAFTENSLRLFTPLYPAPGNRRLQHRNVLPGNADTPGRHNAPTNEDALRYIIPTGNGDTSGRNITPGLMPAYAPTHNRLLSVSRMMGVVLLAGFLFAACTSDADEASARPDRPESVEIRPEVIFSTADALPLTFYLESQGSIEPNRRIEIIPRLSGYLEHHAIHEGARVSRGDTLLKLVDDEYRIQYRQAGNDFHKAEQDYMIERRLRGFAEADTVNDRSLRIRTGLMQAELNLERAALDLSYTTLTAPFSGEVHTMLNLAGGAYIRAGEKLGDLYDHSVVKVRFDMLETELALVSPGMQVMVVMPDREEVTGRVASISPVVDRDRKTGQVLVEIPNRNNRLKTGMMVTGRIFTDSMTGGARFPRSALLERDGRPLVFKLNRDTVEWIYIEPLAVTSDWVLIDHPDINPGDTLAVDRHFAVSHLQKVNVRMRLE